MWNLEAVVCVDYYDNKIINIYVYIYVDKLMDFIFAKYNSDFIVCKSLKNGIHVVLCFYF